MYGYRQNVYAGVMRNWLVVALTVVAIACMLLVRVLTPPAVRVAAAPAEVTADLYLAQAENGKLVIYEAGKDTPALITNIAVESLPLADQRALAEGIVLDTEVELAKLLEDYGS